MSFEADPVLYAALSGDGKIFAYVLEKQGRSSLWLWPRNTEIGALLKNGWRAWAESQRRHCRMMPAVWPSWQRIMMPKGTSMCFQTIRQHQSPNDSRKGVSGWGAGTVAGRQPGLFQRLFPGEVLPQLATMDLAAHAGNQDIPRVETLREGAFPAVSPNGESLAFVSFNKDPGGTSGCLTSNRKGKIHHEGPCQDVYPAWSVNGKSIYFSRFNADTNGDGTVTFDDNAVICQVAVEDSDLQVYPLTSGTFSAYQPMMALSEILFLSNINGTGNIWKLPSGGQIPLKENVQAQTALARLLASRLPREDALAVLAYYKVLENFGADGHYGAEAAYEIGKLYQAHGAQGSGN